MKPHLLFLTERMLFGFGVELVIHQLSTQLVKLGYRVTIACLNQDATFPSFESCQIIQIAPDPEQIQQWIQTQGVDLVVAHTPPFFSILPALQKLCPCWAWEHGDPTPALFGGEEAKHRDGMRQHKIQHVYHNIAGVIAISDFIRHDIQFPQATIIYNGCDHAPDWGNKGLREFSLKQKQPLRVGTLIRLGKLESLYKGNVLFQELQSLLKAEGVAVEMHVMGKGTPADAKDFEDQGIHVHLNAPETEKWQYLRDLDIFITCSLWEGFNLPLAEAQAMGTIGIALDTGAHPEVTPFVMSNLREAVWFIKACRTNSRLLEDYSRQSYHFVRNRFSWENAGFAFHKIAVPYLQHEKIQPRPAKILYQKFRKKVGAVLRKLGIREYIPF